jgi:hypothetical protein
MYQNRAVAIGGGQRHSAIESLQSAEAEAEAQAEAEAAAAAVAAARNGEEEEQVGAAGA